MSYYQADGRNYKVYDFQETFQGLGELNEEDDAFNSETFGLIDEVGKDFDFGGISSAGTRAAAPPPPQDVSYAQAASHTAHDDEFMQDLWGTGNAPIRLSEQSQQQEHILSLDEIEAQLTSMNMKELKQFPNLNFMNQSPIGYGQQGAGQYMMPNQFGYYPPPMYPQFGQPPVQMPQYPPQFSQDPRSQQFHQFPPHQQPQFQQFQQPPQAQPTQHLHQPLASQVPQSSQVRQVPQHPEIHQSRAQLHAPNTEAEARSNVEHLEAILEPPTPYPTLGSEEIDVNSATNEEASEFSWGKSTAKSHNRVNLDNFPVLGARGGKPVSRSSNSGGKPVLNDLTPEQEAKLNRRHDKVSRIMKYSGIMNPKDKDFVTRFQLSQIVTDDPYNEDFYAQVYKVIRPKGGFSNQPQSEHNNSIAQAYLDQSGHRLGGRYKRADVALQRMQQQIQKAVTVAKGRNNLTQFAKEGALGKIAIGSGKKPRQQMEILSRAAEREKDNDVLKPSNDKTRKYSKKDIKTILENIFSELMSSENQSGIQSTAENNKLWESLCVLDQPSTSGDEESVVNPFIQCLNIEKTLKILPRIFKFLNRQQAITIVTLVMSNLENLTVIKEGSYTTYSDKKVPEKIERLVSAYSMTFSKVLMNAAQDFKFNEIIGLLVILVEHNNVSFVSTTKVGLKILTTLLSRAELIRGEGKMSATDLSEWSSCYDELFTSLESRIAAIFPPNDVDDGSTAENYVWQFLATLALGGKLSHQRIIVDEVRDDIFNAMSRAKEVSNEDMANVFKKQNILNNLNMFLVVMGLVADENEIKELQT